MTHECTAIVDYDEARECELTCGDEAVFLCCGEPRCDQCAHDWLDELDGDAQHTVSVIDQSELVAQEPAN